MGTPFEYAPAPESRDVVTVRTSYGLFIDGEFVDPLDGSAFKTVNPASEEVLAEVSEAQGTSRRWLYWLPAVAVMAAIFLLSSQSGLRVSEDVAVDRPFRVTGHLLAYALLAALLLVAVSGARRPRARDVLIAFGLTIAYALSDEWHQSFVPDRTGRLDDVLTDAIGALVGLAVGWLVLGLRASRRERGLGTAR